MDSSELTMEIQLSDLPDEIIEFILTYLPPYQDLENCRLVCKRFYTVVKELIRRSKLNLQKGLLDFRLEWQVFAQPNEHVGNVGIAGRFSHSAVYTENSMYVFGGGSSSDTTFNDLWRFDLSEMRWERPHSSGSYPSPKGSASMVKWLDQLVLFGGWRYPSLYPPYQPWCLFDELHFYDLAEKRWTLHVLMPCPPPIAGHSATVHGERMIVFGGYQISDGVNSLNNETWCLNLRELRWWQPRILGNTKPPPRYGQYQIDLDEKHLLIVGGCGGPNSVFSDAWLLDMTRDDAWVWRPIPVRNKNYGASHMWCNPACRVNSQLVVLGPTPNMPNDFHMIKQTRGPVGGGGGGGGIGIGAAPIRLGINQNNGQPEPPAIAGGINQRLNNVQNGAAANARPQLERHFNRRAILDQHMANANNALNNNNYNGWNQAINLQPRTGRVSELHNVPAREERPTPPTPPTVPTSTTANGGSSLTNDTTTNSRKSNNDVEAANRLQRNLALRCRENEPVLPKRFDDVLFEDPFRMAAFNVQTRNVSKDHSERIRRMEEKMNALRNSRRNALAVAEQNVPQIKRIKRNVLSLFVCDLSAALSNEPHLQWLEYKNSGIIPGAPERLILSTMVAGNGELILFGGVHKETLGEITHQVSNSIHFLSARRDVV